MKAVSGKSKKKYEEWDISNAMETLVRAQEIKDDPELLKKVEKLMKSKKKAMDSGISNLKELRKAAASRIEEISTMGDDED